MPRWNPIPSVLCQEPPTEAADPPAKEPKTNGYIFKRSVDGKPGETRYIPKICRALPAYPKTYGLICQREDCQHCHPDTAAEVVSDMYTRLPSWWLYTRNWNYNGYGYSYTPAPGSCSTGRRGCKYNKMIRMRPAKDKVAAAVTKDETRRRVARAEQALAAEEKQDEKTCGKTQRLSKWETSISKPIDEGCELAFSEDVVMSADGRDTESRDIQLAILASLGLLDDYEAEEADVTLNSLPRNEDLYTIRYKPGRKKVKTRGSPGEAEVPILDDDVDWELVIGSPSEGSMSWTMLDE